MKAFTLATLMTLAASPVFAFNLNDAANAVSAMQNSKQQGQVKARKGQANLLKTLGSNSALHKALSNDVENREDLDRPSALSITSFAAAMALTKVVPGITSRLT